MVARSEWDARVHDDSGAGGVAVTPSDTLPMSRHARALYVGGAGDLTVVMLEGNAVTYVAVPAGALLPIRVSQVMSTGTTASFIVAIF